MNGTCSHSFDYMQWVRWSLLPACVIITMFCFLERRVNLWPTCCHGRPGVAFPVNLVDSYTDRWSFAFAFGSMATFVFRVGELTASFDTGHVDVMLQG
ncbi:stimulated by retinoic acid gene 6 protein-like [Acanthaster planci]|uniref:Stimulated by retinoic acid gene 6 protein-like n=1 Tax=Acanthaster planci TaxID=133434 RepID=A0A8B8A2W2_ACAPL|nr:stimulated by retinoic acid gene 6 protein-like [Acanthaster planci]